MKLKDKILKAFGSVEYWAKGHKSEILLGAGISAVIFGTISACSGARKVDDILDDHECDISEVKARYEEEGLDTDPEYKREYNRKIVDVYRVTAWEFCKAFGPAIVLETVGIGLIIKSHTTLKAEKLQVIAAYNALDTVFRDYRDRVRAKYGEEEDRKLYFGTYEDEIEVETEGKDGKKKKKKEKVDVYPNNCNDFARVFDWSCPDFHREEREGIYAMRANFIWLRGIQSEMSRKLQIHHQITLNEVYAALRMPLSKAGAAVGWRDVAHGGKSDYISFGIDDENACVILTDGKTEGILLQFDPDGVILDDKFDEISGTNTLRPY